MRLPAASSRRSRRPPCAARDALKPWRHRSWIYPAIRTSLSRPPTSLTCASGPGRENRSARRSTCSARMRSPASRHACASIRRCRPGPGGRCGPRTNTPAAAHDDTLSKRRGKKVWAASWFQDGVHAATNGTGYGNNWVIAAVVVRLPVVRRLVAIRCWVTGHQVHEFRFAAVAGPPDDADAR